MDQSAAYRKEGECKLYSETTERPIPLVIAIHTKESCGASFFYLLPPERSNLCHFFFFFQSRDINTKIDLSRGTCAPSASIFVVQRAFFGSKLSAHSARLVKNHFMRFSAYFSVGAKLFSRSRERGTSAWAGCEGDGGVKGVGKKKTTSSTRVDVSHSFRRVTGHCFS